MTVPLAIVDDVRASRNSLAEKLSYYGQFTILFTAENGEDFLVKMKQARVKPQLVLMDIEMPKLNGVETVAIGSSLYPDTKFLMLTVLDNDDKIFDSIKAGSSGYLLKDEKTEVIMESIFEILDQGGAPMSPSIARRALNMLSRASLPEKKENTSSNLSERETVILHLLVQGLDYRATAEKLFVSPNTIRTHIGNIYQKLHVNSKAQAIRIALKKGLI